MSRAVSQMMPDTTDPHAGAGHSTWFRIQPSKGWTTLRLAEIWQYRELVYFLAWREVKVRYKQTLIGVAWVILQPLAMMAIFWLLFGRMAQLPSDGLPYPLFVLVALLPWQFFARVVSESTSSLITDQRLITRVYFPRLVVPIATGLAALVDFIPGMCLVAILMMSLGVVPGTAIVFLPIVVLLLLAAALGVGFWLSALNVEYRDVMHAVPFLVQLWFFVTPVVYSTSLLSGPWRILFYLNPMTAVVEGFRWCLLGSEADFSFTLALSSTITMALFFSGLIWFRYRERVFVDQLGSGGA